MVNYETNTYRDISLVNEGIPYMIYFAALPAMFNTSHVRENGGA